MRTLSFRISGQSITGGAISDLVGNSKNYIQASFTFSNEWAGLMKVAIFTANSKSYPVILDDNNLTCVVPSIALTGEYFDVGVYGGSDGTRLTTNTARIRVEESVRCKPPFDMIDMYKDMLGHIENEAKSSEGIHGFRINPSTLIPQILNGGVWENCAGIFVVDSILDGESENPIQNKAVKEKTDLIDAAIAENTAHRSGTVLDSSGVHGFRVNPSTNKGQSLRDGEWSDIEAAAQVDDTFSDISTNPVQNRVLKSKIDSMDTAIATNTTHGAKNILNINGAHGFRVNPETKKSQYYDTTDDEWKNTAGAVDVDSALSDVSTNPVQNKVIKDKLDDIEGDIDSLESDVSDLEGKNILSTDGAYNFRVNPSTKRPQYYNESTEVWENTADSGGGGGTITVDDAFSTSSENPVQNKVITNKINTMDTAIAANTTHSAAGVTDNGGIHGVRINGTSKVVEYYDTTDDEWKSSIALTDDALSDDSTNPVQNKKVKEAIDGHKNGAVTDSGGVHGFRVNPTTKKGQYYESGEWKDIAGSGGGGVEVGDVSSFAAVGSHRTATLTWIDPTDFEVDGRKIAEWSKTVIVKKIGSVPASPSDGAVVVTETTRNQYSSTGYEDTSLSYGYTYYYRAFVYTKQDVVTNGSSVSVTPARSEIGLIPTQSGAITYDGTEQTAHFSSDGSGTVTITGSIAETNAGTYSISFTPTEDYKWSSYIQSEYAIGERDALPSYWEIRKADAVATLSSNAITLDGETTDDTVTVSNASGTVSVSSSDTNIATASISNDTITISSVNDTNGTATITVSIAASADGNYAAGTKTITVSCEFSRIYGVTWDGSAASNFTRTDDAVGFTNPSPAVSNGSGSSPFDDISPWKDMVIVDDAAAGKLVSIPKFYYKRDITGSTYSVKISMTQEEGFSVSPAHRDRGDGKGERDVVYVARYHCASNYKSQAGGEPANNYTRAEFRTSIHGLGSGIWQWDYSVWQTIHMLYLVEFADWDSQKVIGKGCSANSAKFNMGATDSMLYHTGTNQASRDSYGCTQYRHIEGLWDNVYDWCDGVYFSNANINVIDNPANFSDSSGGTLVGTRPTASGWIKAFAKSNVSGYDWFEYCSDKDGAEGSYVCDYCDYNSSGVVLFVGGSYGQVAYFGLFYANGNVAASYKSASIGSRLMKLP